MAEEPLEKLRFRDLIGEKLATVFLMERRQDLFKGLYVTVQLCYNICLTPRNSILSSAFYEILCKNGALFPNVFLSIWQNIWAKSYILNLLELF